MQPLPVQIGDEAEHPRILGEAEQVLDVVDQLEAGIRLLLVAAVTVDQVRADLGRREVLDAEDPPVGQQTDPFAQR